MKLRDHPLMSYHGISNWPPVWIPLHQNEYKILKGEIGFLHCVIYKEGALPNKCFLIIDHEDRGYMASLIFDDTTFCRQIVKLLPDYCGHPTKEIGNIDLSHTL